jgi:hypothetical protein
MIGFMFEPHNQPLLPRRQFYRRMGRYAATAALIVGTSWLIGILGYRITEGMGWIDAILNSAMILGGMGPVDQLHTVGGKLFASFYALFAGIILLVSVGVLIAPLFHRLLHQFHIQSHEDELADKLDESDDEDDEDNEVKDGTSQPSS